MRAEVAQAALDAGARAGQRRQRRAGRPGHARGWWPAPACRTSRCTGAGTATTMDELARLRRRRRGRRARAAAPGSTRCVAPASTPSSVVLDPGSGFAKNAEHNWALLAQARRARRARPAAAGRRVPQAVPRRAAGRRRRRRPARRRARRRHGGDHRAGRRGRRLVRAGARGAGDADAVRVVAGGAGSDRPRRRARWLRPVAGDGRATGAPWTRSRCRACGLRVGTGCWRRRRASGRVHHRPGAAPRHPCRRRGRRPPATVDYGDPGRAGGGGRRPASRRPDRDARPAGGGRRPAGGTRRSRSTSRCTSRGTGHRALRRRGGVGPPVADVTVDASRRSRSCWRWARTSAMPRRRSAPRWRWPRRRTAVTRCPPS